MPDSVCPAPFSLAVTGGISIDFFSWRYSNVLFHAVPHPFGSNERSHSEIPGSKNACISPGHIVACHVLLRHLSQVIHLIALFTISLV